MNKKKELLVQIMWELAGSIFYAIGIYNFAGRVSYDRFFGYFDYFIPAV